MFLLSRFARCSSRVPPAQTKWKHYPYFDACGRCARPRPPNRGGGPRRAGLLLLSAPRLGTFLPSLHSVVLGVGSCRSRARTTLCLPAFFTAHLSLSVLTSALACVSSDPRCALVHCLDIGLALPTPIEHCETIITQWWYGLPSNPTYRLSAVALVPLVPCY